jgi:predicted RND superfamily exporter protein
MRALLTPVVALVAWGIGVVTGVALMARQEIPAAPMTDPPKWE